MIVIGAGNVAMDVARTALRRGVKDVNIVVRSDRYTASKEEKEYAEIEGARFIFNKAPVEITDRGLAKINADGSTTRAGLFASGDVVRGAKTVVEAAETSKRVAYAMDMYLKGLPN